MARAKQISRGGKTSTSGSATVSTADTMVTAATASTSKGATTRVCGSTLSQAVVYERALNKAAKDTEILIMDLDCTQDTATTFVYSMFEVMRTHGLEVNNTNPEIVIDEIQDNTMKALIIFKKRQSEEGQPSRVQCKAPDEEPPSWQRVAYQLEDANFQRTCQGT